MSIERIELLNADRTVVTGAVVIQGDKVTWEGRAHMLKNYKVSEIGNPRRILTPADGDLWAEMFVKHISTPGGGGARIVRTPTVRKVRKDRHG